MSSSELDELDVTCVFMFCTGDDPINTSEFDLFFSSPIRGALSGRKVLFFGEFVMSNVFLKLIEVCSRCEGWYGSLYATIIFSDLKMIISLHPILSTDVRLIL